MDRHDHLTLARSESLHGNPHWHSGTERCTCSQRTDATHVPALAWNSETQKALTPYGVFWYLWQAHGAAMSADPRLQESEPALGGCPGSPEEPPVSDHRSFSGSHCKCQYSTVSPASPFQHFPRCSEYGATARICARDVGSPTQLGGDSQPAGGASGPPPCMYQGAGSRAQRHPHYSIPLCPPQRQLTQLRGGARPSPPRPTPGRPRPEGWG